MRKFSRILESVEDPMIDEIKYIFMDLQDNGFKIEIRPYWEDGMFYFYNKDSQHYADKDKNGYLITGKADSLVKNNPFKAIRDFLSIEERMLDLGYELEEKDDVKSVDSSQLVIDNRWGRKYEFRFPFKEIKK